GQQPNQLLDQRDLAVSNLSQLVGVQVVQNSSGYSLFLGNGQPLVVSGQNYNLTTQPSSTNPTEMTVAWQGLPGSTTAAQPLTSAALQGGT
ncbi:FlgK family flagellar hook-associated protein, partial [Burkholderia sp. SIMBA_062]